MLEKRKKIQRDTKNNRLQDVCSLQKLHCFGYVNVLYKDVRTKKQDKILMIKKMSVTHIIG